jgi:hypothetical protein
MLCTGLITVLFLVGGWFYLVLWVVLALVWWFVLGIVLGIVVPLIGPLRRFRNRVFEPEVASLPPFPASGFPAVSLGLVAYSQRLLRAESMLL